MADENVTTPTQSNPESPTPKLDPDTQFVPAPVKSDTKVGAPSPAAFAKKAPGAAKKGAPAPAAAGAAYSDADVAEAEKFGRVADDGTVFVKDGDEEREIGQFPDAENKDTALKPYVNRYLDLKGRVELFANRLKSRSIKTREIDESIKNLTEEAKAPAVVGDLPSLRTRIEELRVQAEARKAVIAEEHRAAVEKAVAARTEIVEEAEKLVADLGDDTNWRSTADKFKSLFDKWQAHQKSDARIDKPQADELWKRFSSARSSFNARRRKWAQARDAERDAAKKAKEAIIAEANEIKDSTEWVETSHKFNALMDRWKKAGRAGRRDDDALWAQFRAAADTFFNARQADRDQIAGDERENLAKKEALVAKAEALLPVKDEKAARAARTALGKIQDEWDTIGRVPRADLHRIEDRLNAVDRAIKDVEDAAWKNSDPETDARKSSFETQLLAQLKELDEKIAAETDPAKKAKLEAEKATKEQWLKVVK